MLSKPLKEKGICQIGDNIKNSIYQLLKIFLIYLVVWWQIFFSKIRNNGHLHVQGILMCKHNITSEEGHVKWIQSCIIVFVGLFLTSYTIARTQEEETESYLSLYFSYKHIPTVPHPWYKSSRYWVELNWVEAHLI